jgi:hypothetical protein
VFKYILAFPTDVKVTLPQHKGLDVEMEIGVDEVELLEKQVVEARRFNAALKERRDVCQKRVEEWNEVADGMQEMMQAAREAQVQPLGEHGQFVMDQYQELMTRLEVLRAEWKQHAVSVGVSERDVYIAQQSKKHVESILARPDKKRKSMAGTSKSAKKPAALEIEHVLKNIM